MTAPMWLVGVRGALIQVSKIVKVDREGLVVFATLDRGTADLQVFDTEEEAEEALVEWRALAAGAEIEDVFRPVKSLDAILLDAVERLSRRLDTYARSEMQTRRAVRRIASAARLSEGFIDALFEDEG